MLLYYYILLIISILLTFIFVCRWNARYSAYCTLIFLIVPIACYGYVLIASADNLNTALIGTKLNYCGGIFGSLFFALSILTLCKFRLSKFSRILLFAAGFFIFLFILFVEKNSFFYKSVTFDVQNKKFAKEYGPVHLIFYVFVVIIYLLCFIGVIKGLTKRYAVSKKSLLTLLFLLSLNCLFFFVSRLFEKSIELVPVSYLITQIALIIMPERFVLYDIDDTMVDVSKQRGDIAIISVDKNRNFLGCNEVAKNYFPVLTMLKIDDSIKPSAAMSDSRIDFFNKLELWIKLIDKNKGESKVEYEYNKRHYQIISDYIKKNGKRIKGYNFMIRDDTEDYKYHKLIEDYNKTLEKDVEDKAKEISQINEVFGKNVSPQIRDYLLKGNVALGGETRYITIMFCDIRSFTSLSEKLESESVVKMLNQYFTAMEKCISTHNGVINKYMGDAIMALFGAPMPSKSHERDAFAAALDMRKTLKELNKKFIDQGLPEISFGIGLHSGPVLAGNIGAENRMEYTVIGDTVNTASRIEGLCKNYKKTLLISDDTAAAIMNSTSKTFLQFVDSTDVRGRKEKVSLFTY